jgi:bifunctional ADP-heptose synthase (sugar kinase/adenylyltransferase)
MLLAAGQPPREWHRLDIKNRTPLPGELTERVLEALEQLWPRLDALVVLDQVSEVDCGVVTSRVRARLAELGDAEPGRFVLADSREHIGLFRSVWLKPNQAECVRASEEGNPAQLSSATEGARLLAVRAGRPVFCTCGERGIMFVDPKGGRQEGELIPGFPVSGPIDIVGAGDSTSAGIACAMAVGLSPQQAAAFGNLIASITIQQLGTTGTATPQQVRQRWAEVTTG